MEYDKIKRFRNPHFCELGKDLQSHHYVPGHGNSWFYVSCRLFHPCCNHENRCKPIFYVTLKFIHVWTNLKHQWGHIIENGIEPKSRSKKIIDIGVPHDFVAYVRYISVYNLINTICIRSIYMCIFLIDKNYWLSLVYFTLLIAPAELIIVCHKNNEL